MIFIFYGSEGSGKSTQAKLLAKKLKMTHISTGDIVRGFADTKHPEFGIACQKILDNGVYLSDDYMLRMLECRLCSEDTKKGFILDGFPRNLEQAKFLDKFLAKRDKSLKCAFYLNIDEKTAIKRVQKRKRDNHDSLTKLKSRLNQYYLSEDKTLNYYKENKVLKEIDGKGSIGEVFGKIIKTINQLKSA